MAGALRLFASKGFEASGVRAIAQEVGLTPAALYYYGDKEKLLISIMQSGIDALSEMVREVMSVDTSPTGQLRGLVRGHVTVHASRRDEALVADTELRALTPSHRRMIVKQRDDYEQVWAKVLRRGVELGEFSLADPTVARLCLLEMCTGVAGWYVPTGRLSVGQIADVIASIALRIVGAGSSEAIKGRQTTCTRRGSRDTACFRRSSPCG